MIIATHIIAGGVAGDMIGNSILALILGIVLHFAFDAIPHYDNVDNHRWTWKQILFTSFDFLLAGYLFFFVFDMPISLELLKSPFAWGAFGGFLPDLLDNVPFWSKQFRVSRYGKVIHHFHDSLHKEQPSLLVGMSTQLGLLALFTWIYFYMGGR